MSSAVFAKRPTVVIGHIGVEVMGISLFFECCEPCAPQAMEMMMEKAKELEKSLMTAMQTAVQHAAPCDDEVGENGVHVLMGTAQLEMPEGLLLDM